MNRWNPLREIVDMQRTMDRMLDEVNRNVSNGSSEWASVGRWVTLDVTDNGEQYVVHADVPGINPDDIEVTIHENTLTISGELTQEELSEGTRRILSERYFGKFRRSITLPDMVDMDNVSADYADGILTLTMPKSEQAKPRQIAVKNVNTIQHAN